MFYPAAERTRTIPRHSRRTNRPGLMLVTDSDEKFRELRALLEVDEVEVISPDLLAESELQCDLVVVAVGPDKLEQALKSVRSKNACRMTPLLVAADGKLNTTALAGVLPFYRAMACGPAELRTLVRQRFRPATRNRRLML